MASVNTNTSSSCSHQGFLDHFFYNYSNYFMCIKTNLSYFCRKKGVLYSDRMAPDSKILESKEKQVEEQNFAEIRTLTESPHSSLSYKFLHYNGAKENSYF